MGRRVLNVSRETLKIYKLTYRHDGEKVRYKDMNVYDVILERHSTSNRKNVCIFYDENKELAIKKMSEYVKKNGFTITEKDGRFSIATLILRERTPSGEIIKETPYHEIFDTITGKKLGK